MQYNLLLVFSEYQAGTIQTLTNISQLPSLNLQFQIRRWQEPYLILKSLCIPILLSIEEVNQLSHRQCRVPIIVWFPILITSAKDRSNAKVAILINISRCMIKTIKAIWMEASCIPLKVKGNLAIALRMTLQILGNVVQVSINKKLQSFLRIKQI